MQIIHRGKEIGSNPTLDTNNQTIREAVEPVVDAGIYLVKYSACFVSGECSDGQFAYKGAVEKIAGSDNKTRTNEVEIQITENSIEPAVVLVSRGTKVTWKNMGNGPSGTQSELKGIGNYYPAQNSGELASGQAFSVVFDKIGDYPYHLLKNSKIEGKIFVQKE